MGSTFEPAKSKRQILAIPRSATNFSWAEEISSSTQVLQGSKDDSEKSHHLWWTPVRGKSQPLAFKRLTSPQKIPAGAFQGPKSVFQAIAVCVSTSGLEAGAVSNTARLPKCQQETLSQLQKQSPECLYVPESARNEIRVSMLHEVCPGSLERTPY